MKVKELVEKLNKLNEDLIVYIPNENDEFREILYCDDFAIQNEEDSEIVVVVLSHETED